MDTVKRSALQYTHNVAAIRAKLDECVYHNEQTNLKVIAELIGLDSQAASLVLTHMLMFDIEENRSDLISMYAFITRRSGAEQGIPGPWYWNNILPNWKRDGVTVAMRQSLASTSRNSAHQNRIEWYCKPVGELLASINIPAAPKPETPLRERMKYFANLVIIHLVYEKLLGSLLEEKSVGETVIGALWHDGVNEWDDQFNIAFKHFTLEVSGAIVAPLHHAAKKKERSKPVFIKPGEDNIARGMTFDSDRLDTVMTEMGFVCMDEPGTVGRQFRYATLAPLPITFTFSFPNGWGFKIDPVEQQA